MAAPRARSLSTLRPVPSGTTGCFLQIYTGPLLRTHPLTVQSMRANNPAFHWITVHVGDLGDAHAAGGSTNWAPNYQLVQATPAEVEAWIRRDLGVNVSVSLSKPSEWRRYTHDAAAARASAGVVNGYKWNDFKPFYGALFARWIRGCQFFGYADADVAFGALSSVLTPAYLARYDVISDSGAKRLTGPFALFRNTRQLRLQPKRCRGSALHRYEKREDTKHKEPWAAMLEDSAYINFDEVGFHSCLKDDIKDGKLRARMNTIEADPENRTVFQCIAQDVTGGRERACVWSAAAAASIQPRADHASLSVRIAAYIHFHGTKHRIGKQLAGMARDDVAELTAGCWVVRGQSAAYELRPCAAQQASLKAPWPTMCSVFPCAPTTTSSTTTI